MKFCIYSGTFNPVHIAHLIAAQIVKEEIKADKIVFIPAHIPPHKENDDISAKHRMEMLKLSVADNQNFEIDDIEFQSTEKSYTYITIKKLLENRKKNITAKIDFIIGSDAFKHIDSWYESTKLAKLVRFVIIPREENFEIKSLFEKIELKDYDYKIVNVPFIDISSSDIRKRVKQGKSIKHMVTKEVEQYIYDNELFKD